MPLDLALDLAHALDPVSFVQDRLKFEPDPWQAQLLRSRASWILLNCCRQSGKSTTTAALALHTAIYNPLGARSFRPRQFAAVRAVIGIEMKNISSSARGLNS